MIRLLCALFLTSCSAIAGDCDVCKVKPFDPLNLPFNNKQNNQIKENPKIAQPIEKSNFKKIPILLVFASFSMPKLSLKKLAEDLKKVDGALVIRGLKDNSFVNTAKEIKELGEGVLLDPTLFECYEIKSVPAFVLRQDQDVSSFCSKSYDKVSGNITLEYALSQFAENNQSPQAAELLDRLRKPVNG